MLPAMSKFDAEKLCFLGKPSCSYTKDQPAIRISIKCCCRLGKRDHIMLGKEADRRSQPNRFGCLGCSRESNKGINKLCVKWRHLPISRTWIVGGIVGRHGNMLSNPHRLESQVLG